jgi:hypothetical protein
MQQYDQASYVIMQIVNVYCSFNITNEGSTLLGNEAVSLGECLPTFRWTHQPLKTKAHTQRHCVTSQKTGVPGETAVRPWDLTHIDLCPILTVIDAAFDDTGLWSESAMTNSCHEWQSWRRLTYLLTPRIHTYIYVYNDIGLCESQIFCGTN